MVLGIKREHRTNIQHISGTPNVNNVACSMELRSLEKGHNMKT